MPFLLCITSHISIAFFQFLFFYNSKAASRIHFFIFTFAHRWYTERHTNSTFTLTLRWLMSYIYGAPNLNVSRSHTTMQHSRQDSSGRVISSSQRPLPDSTRHSQQKTFMSTVGIRTHNASRRAAADPGFRLRGHWDRVWVLYEKIYRVYFEYYFPWRDSPPVCHGLLIHEVPRSHSGTLQSVGILWTSDQHVAETSTWQYKILTTERHDARWDSNPQSQLASGRRPTP